MATNPFEDGDANYFVLINDEGQHSLWPVFADVPDGWKVMFREDKRQACSVTDLWKPRVRRDRPFR